MRTHVRSSVVLILGLVSLACGGGGGVVAVDAAVDRADAWSELDGGGADDASVPDGGGGCGADQHECDGVCTDDGFNDPATGCRLGCGEACPGGTMALCDEEGQCGIRGCTPMTCEDLSVMCGLVDDGCGRRTNCGTCDVGLRCESGACICMPDDGEPENDSRTGLTTATTIDDSVEPPPFALRGTLHEEGDEDWFQVAIVDGSDGGSPALRVELVAAPAGSDYEVAAFFGCTDTGGENTTSCSTGTNDDSVEQGCTSAGLDSDLIEMSTSCGGFFTDENGTLWIRVRAASWADTCGDYELRVSGS